jgi:rhodanese-related sulfurtransferase
MKKFQDLIRDCLSQVAEIFPWDLAEWLQQNNPPLLLDVREPYEFNQAAIIGSLNVPRGILETACEYNFQETVPALVEAREHPIVVICRSGNRSVLAAYVMQLMGYQNVQSLKTGLHGWNDDEYPLFNAQNQRVSLDIADALFASQVKTAQLEPKLRAIQASAV